MKDRKNAGLSLIELIVVVAIMSVLLAVVGLSISAVSKQKVSGAAVKMKELIQVSKTYAKSKGNCKMTIEGNSDGTCSVYIYTGTTETDLRKLFNHNNIPANCRLGDGPSVINGKIQAKICYGTDEIPIKAGKVYDIWFSRTTGGFLTSYFGNAGDAYMSKLGDDGSGNIVELEKGFAGASKESGFGTPTKIVFTNGDRVAELTLAQYTGFVTISYNG